MIRTSFSKNSTRRLNLGGWGAKICSAFIALLGFGCTSTEELMYGTPYSTFKIMGTVTDINGNDVDNATVRVAEPDVPSNPYAIEMAKTNADGEYEATGQMFPMPQVKVVCIPEDKNLEADSIVVDLDFKGKKDDWYMGHAEKTLNFCLKTKKGNE